MVRCRKELGNLESYLAKPDHFYFEQSYDASSKSFSPAPESSLLQPSARPPKNKGKKGKGRVTDDGPAAPVVESRGKNPAEDPDWTWMDTEVKRLRTMDIFAGCGGLSEGLHEAGICKTEWAIEFEKVAAHAYALNNPDVAVFTDDCNDVLAQIMKGLAAT